MLVQWNYNYYRCYYYFYHAWFEASVWPTIHKTEATHSSKRQLLRGMALFFFRRNKEEVERRGRRDEMKRRWVREADRGQESDSACASHEHKRPQDAECTHGELNADFLFIVACCPQVRKKERRTTHKLTPKLSQYG